MYVCMSLFSFFFRFGLHLATKKDMHYQIYSLINANFRLQFNYCSLVWMFHKNKIINLNKRCLGLVSSFKKNLEVQICTNSFSKPEGLCNRDF